MSAGGLAGALDLVTRVRGVRGAMLVSAADGIVVADQLMEGIKGTAVAALAGSLAGRLGRAMSAAGPMYRSACTRRTSNPVSSCTRLIAAAVSPLAESSATHMYLLRSSTSSRK